MAPRRSHLTVARAATAAPAAIAPTVFGDTNVSIGVVALVIGIMLLVVVVLAVIAIEVSGEHRANAEHRRAHDHV